jgi:hypothetical protein
MISVRVFLFFPMTALGLSMSCSEIPGSTPADSFETITPKKEVEFLSTDTAFEVSIFGKSMFPDLIADHTLVKVVRTRIGFEGGGSYCIELNKFPDMKPQMNRVYNLFLEIDPSEDTRLEIKTLANCKAVP